MTLGQEAPPLGQHCASSLPAAAPLMAGHRRERPGPERRLLGWTSQPAQGLSKPSGLSRLASAPALWSQMQR